MRTITFSEVFSISRLMHIYPPQHIIVVAVCKHVETFQARPLTTSLSVQLQRDFIKPRLMEMLLNEHK